MAFDDKVYMGYIKQDTHLIKRLKKRKGELKYAKGRITRHQELLDEMVKAVEKQSEKRCKKVEMERIGYVIQTQFLLMADFVTDLEQVQDFLPPPK